MATAALGLLLTDAARCCELPASLQLASRAPLRQRRAVHAGYARRSDLPFLKLRARSEHSSDANRMSEASRRGPRLLISELMQAASQRANCTPKRAAQRLKSDRGLRHSEPGYSSRLLRAPPFGERSQKAQNKKTLCRCETAQRSAKTWPKPRRARRASARERRQRR
jgi:hypothetical protein